MEVLLDAVLKVIDVRLFLLCLLIITPLEALMPAQHGKKILRPGLGADVLHFVFSALLIRAGVVVVIIAAVAIGEWFTPPALRQAIVPIPSM